MAKHMSGRCDRDDELAAQELAAEREAEKAAEGEPDEPVKVDAPGQQDERS